MVTSCKVDSPVIPFTSPLMIRLLIMSRSLGKRIWLKPGKKYLFGRVKSESGLYKPILGFRVLINVRQSVMPLTIKRSHDNTW